KILQSANAEADKQDHPRSSSPRRFHHKWPRFKRMTWRPPEAAGCRGARARLLPKGGLEALMHWSTVGQRLIVRTLPLLLSAVLLAFGSTPAPRAVTPAEGPRPDLAQLWSEPADIAA